jgi:hypothetical protein
MCSNTAIAADLSAIFTSFFSFHFFLPPLMMSPGQKDFGKRIPFGESATGLSRRKDLVIVCMQDTNAQVYTYECSCVHVYIIFSCVLDLE